VTDNIAVTAGSGTNVATDERTIASTTVHVQRIVIVNYQTVPIYVGAATITTSAGFRLDPGASLTLHTAAAVEGITSAAYTAAGEDDKVHYISEVSA